MRSAGGFAEIGQFREELRHDVTPRFLPAMKAECLDGLRLRLLRGEARPFVTPGPSRILGLLEVSRRLIQPVPRAIRHGCSRSHSAAVICAFPPA
jgi:hypothetical protein